MTDQIEKLEVIPEGLRVTWDDAHVSLFHNIWLRHNCHCDDCGSSETGIRRLKITDIPEDLELTKATLENQIVSLFWMPEDHVTRYTAKWLRRYCYTTDSRAQRRHKPTIWQSSADFQLPEFDYLEAVDNPSVHLSILEAVLEFGACRLRNIPKTAEETERVTSLLGLDKGSRLRVYDLTLRPDVYDIGDTNRQLEPHTDEGYRAYTGGISLLQTIIADSETGGETILQDGLQAAKYMRENWPEDYRLLTTIPITHHRVDPAAKSGAGEGRWFITRSPVFNLNEDGEVVGVRIHDRALAPLDVEPEFVEPMYQALRRLYDYIYDSKNFITFLLESGDGLVYNNQRMIHGRTGFKDKIRERYMRSSTVDIDEFHSKLRALQQAVGRGDTSLRLPQGATV